ncbi:MAG: hypothetical protein LIO79_03315 [Rikenellaceae bacterium]|nr:hypothetical protein [Rikenellaceae bacterium]
MKKWRDRTPTEKGMILIIIMLIIGIIVRWSAVSSGVAVGFRNIFQDKSEPTQTEQYVR